jgi:outer membrane protein OmpA-like peptidoglycan-associated protein
MNNRRVLTLGVIALGIIGFLCIRVMSPDIEKDLLSRSAAVLQANQIPTSGLTFNGRDALLTGVKGSPEVSEKARRLVDEVPGVRVVQVEYIPAPPVTAVQQLQGELNQALKGRTVELARDSSSLTVKGQSVIDTIVPILAASPQVPVEIRAHGIQRAAAVKTYLVSKGIAPDRLKPAPGAPGLAIEFAVSGGK